MLFPWVKSVVSKARERYDARRRFFNLHRRENMKKFAGVILFVCFCVGPAFVQAQTAPAAAPAKGPSVSQAAQQLEHDWVDAVKAGDTDKLGQLLADDWVGLGYGGGGKATKQSFLADVKSGAIKIQSFEFGPMSVLVIGSVAVVQGSDTEKSTYNGKDTSGKYEWMDVFAKRNGKWVAVRSQTAITK
jgi:ketosteroid isomerase-like protein